MKDPKQILRQYWGYDHFRPLQEPIIQAVLEGKPTLALLPTGGGKSICFQVPALCLEGICIVISPLIALMKDQVEQLRSRGIRATAIYSGMSAREIDITLDNCVYGGFQFLYVSPERVQTEMFRERALRMNVSMVAVDEAHCISQWGYDFRPPYLKIAEFLEEAQITRLVALTASATREVKQDILEKLGMPEATVFQKSFARPNLSYSVFSLENKYQKMLEVLQNVSGSSVIYVRSRKQTKEVADMLVRQGISASHYHAGLSGEERARRQDSWIGGQVRVMVATNAFGMGIDKPDVRTVIHLDVPDSLEAYYQEAGRAGRDEKKAYAVLLYDERDVNTLMQRADESAATIEDIKKVYQALANYYKLAVGSQAYSSFEFDYQAFVKNFDLHLVKTYYALNKLSDEGLIQITDAYREPSRLMFIIPQEEVYKYQVANSAMDAVVKVLLRLYGGELFSNFIKIREKDIAALLKEPVDVAIRQLEYLHQSEIVHYEHASEKPRLTFLTPRFDANSLPIDKGQINWRRTVSMQKAQSIKAYVEERHKCRTRMIQQYFDEAAYEDCGVCDVCLEKRRRHQLLPVQEIKKFIEEGPKSEQELIQRFGRLREEDLVSALRLLMDRKEITLTREERFTLLEN